jgi:hypothetical protein
LLALFAAAIAAEWGHEDLKAGVLLGLTLFKFQYAIPVVLLFLAWKSWRFLRRPWWAYLFGSPAFLDRFPYVRSIIAMSAK